MLLEFLVVLSLVFSIVEDLVGDLFLKDVIINEDMLSVDPAVGRSYLRKDDDNDFGGMTER